MLHKVTGEVIKQGLSHSQTSSSLWTADAKMLTDVYIKVWSSVLGYLHLPASLGQGQVTAQNGHQGNKYRIGCNFTTHRHAHRVDVCAPFGLARDFFLIHNYNIERTTKRTSC